jgi:hypothetical protein
VYVGIVVSSLLTSNSGKYFDGNRVHLCKCRPTVCHATRDEPEESAITLRRKRKNTEDDMQEMHQLRLAALLSDCFSGKWAAALKPST